MKISTSLKVIVIAFSVHSFGENFLEVELLIHLVRIEFAEDLVRIHVLPLVGHHLHQKLVVCGPSGNCFHAFTLVAYHVEVFIAFETIVLRPLRHLPHCVVYHAIRWLDL